MGLIDGIVGGLMGMATQDRAARKSYEYQLDLNNRQNEFSAKEAEKARQWQESMYDKDYNQHTYGAMRKQMEDAGLSVGLMYGNGGTQGVGGNGAPGTSAASASSSPGVQVGAPQIDPLTLSQIGVNDALANKYTKEAQRTEAETPDNEDYRENIKADTRFKNAAAGASEAEAKTINAMRKYLVENQRLEAVGQWINVVKEKYFSSHTEDEMLEGAGVNVTNEILQEEFSLNARGNEGLGDVSITGAQVMNQLWESYAEVRLKDATAAEKRAIAALTKKEVENYREKLGALIMQAQAAKEQAAAAKKNSETNAEELEIKWQELENLIAKTTAEIERIAFETGGDVTWKSISETLAEWTQVIGDIYGKKQMAKALTKSYQNKGNSYPFHRINLKW